MLLSDNHKIYLSKFQKLKHGGTPYGKDACHIKPLSISNDDTVSNGFALCPNLHRTFDRGIIGVDKHYRVVISRYITEDETRAYSLKQLVGTELYLPMPPAHFPLVENFLWHLGVRFER